MLQQDDWLTVEEAIDHVIDVTVDKYKRLRSIDAGAWINSWALIGIELDANDPPYRKGLPAWRDHSRRLAGNWDLDEHLGSGLFHDRDGLRDLLIAVNWDKAEAEKILKNGLLSLQAKGERQADSTWSASRWSYFTNMKSLAEHRDTLRAHLPDGKVENAIKQTAWNDLEEFKKFVTTAGSLNKATHAFIDGVRFLQAEDCHANRWAYFEEHLQKAAA